MTAWPSWARYYPARRRIAAMPRRYLESNAVSRAITRRPKRWFAVSVMGAMFNAIGAGGVECPSQ
jgi:hypothetical protein